jgi:hypothetical protein
MIHSQNSYTFAKLMSMHKKTAQSKLDLLYKNSIEFYFFLNLHVFICFGKK